MKIVPTGKEIRMYEIIRVFNKYLIYTPKINQTLFTIIYYEFIIFLSKNSKWIDSKIKN